MVAFGFYALTAVMILSVPALFMKFSKLESQVSKRLTRTYFLVILVWLVYMSLVSNLGLLDSLSLPPRMPLLIIAPATVVIVLYQKALKAHFDKLSIGFLTYIQSFRILVELLIFGGFVNGIFPQLLTFEGQNMDILVGITALIVAPLHQRSILSNKGLLIWNFVSAGILLFTIATFARSAYFLGLFTDPMIKAFVRMPYLLLPGFLAPVAIFFHVLSIRKLILEIRK